MRRWFVSLSFQFGSDHTSPLTDVRRAFLLGISAMSFSDQEVAAVIDKVYRDKFLGLGSEARVKWVHFVASVDDEPKNAHAVMFYAAVARVLAEVMGSAQPADYAELHMRDLIVGALKMGAEPFQGEDEDSDWQAVKLQPAQITLALRVQARAVAKCSAPSAPVLPGSDALTKVMEQYVQSQQAQIDKDKKKGTLSYNLKGRIAEVGLSMLPDHPTEDAMIRLEASGKAAHAQGRHYVGAAEGEDVQVHFSPVVD